MKNKIVLVTGASSGIGKATAMGLAKMGATVIVHGRNGEKIKSVQQEIIDLTGNQKVDSITADLFVLSDIRKMAAIVSQKYERLDVLVNNAGGMMAKHRATTVDGIEKTMALNVIAPYLLTWLLMNSLKKSEAARVIMVASSAHRIARPDFNDMEFNRHYSPLRAYAASKLILLLMAQRFANVLQLQGLDNVTINSMHPGGVATNFLNKDFGFVLNLLGKISKPFFTGPEKGADTIVWLSSDDAVKGITGRYFENRQQAGVQKKYNTKGNEQLAWNYCKLIAGN